MRSLCPALKPPGLTLKSAFPCGPALPLPIWAIAEIFADLGGEIAFRLGCFRRRHELKGLLKCPVFPSSRHGQAASSAVELT